MNKLFKQVLIFVLVFGAAAVLTATGALAQTKADVGTTSNAGMSLLSDLSGNLKGTVGTTVGLIISLFGLYVWIWKQIAWGIIIAVAGGLLTAFPGIYDNLSSGAKAAFNQTSGGKTQ